MPQPAEVTAIADELVDAYQAVADIIARAQTEFLANPTRRRALTARLRGEVTAALDNADDQLRSWLVDRFPTVYLLGADTTAASLGFTVDPFALVHQSAIQRIVDDLFDDLLKATRFVRRDVKKFIGESAKLVAEAKLRDGETAIQAGRRLAAIIDEHGIKGITYADGSRHGIDEYSEMLLRTKTAVAYNEGTFNAASEAGIVFYEVFDGHGCGWSNHNDPDIANGQIVTEAEARANPISHPRCQRSFGARPDLTSRQGERSTTAAQRSDQKAFEIARAVSRPTRQKRRPRQARVRRSARG